MVGVHERCESCDADIGGAKTCRHCGWVRPAPEERADDRIRMAVAIFLMVLVTIVSAAFGLWPR